MCTRCGRPQQAGTGTCAACGAVLPEAPLPPVVSPVPGGPVLSVELSGGRVLLVEGHRLSFRPGASATPFLLELESLRRLALVSRPGYEALGLTVAALVALPFVPLVAVQTVLVLVAAVGVALALARRRYTLVLESSGAIETRWNLGPVRRGSPRERHLREAWRTLADTVRARGVEVKGAGSDGALPRA